MATYTIAHPGNTALQTEIWTLTLPEAVRVCRLLRCVKVNGTYWDATLGKPTRAAKHRNAPTVTISTAGFSTGEFANALAASGSAITERSTAG
jgi:hypothetical protein